MKLRVSVRFIAVLFREVGTYQGHDDDDDVESDFAPEPFGSKLE